MKSGGPWNLRGLRPQAREAARGAARKSGVSVGEWLNSIIRTTHERAEPKENTEFDREADYDQRDAGYHDRDDDRPEERHWRDHSRGDRHQQARSREQHRERGRNRDRDRDQDRSRGQYRDRDQNREQIHNGKQNRVRDQTRERDRDRNREGNREWEQPRTRDPNSERDGTRAREQSRAGEADRGQTRETAGTRDQLGELHGRLDQLTNQLERLTHTESVQRKLFMRDRPAPGELGDAPTPSLTGAPAARQRIERPAGRNQSPANSRDLSIDDAIAEIAARQRALDGAASAGAVAVPDADVQPPPDSPLAEITARQRVLDGVPPVADPHAGSLPGATVNIGGLERQLRDLTARIEELPSGELAKTITAIRTDLAEITRQLNEALPRRAVEPLELEIKALAQRIDQSRQSGIDVNALSGLEGGLAEVRDALRGLTTSESLVGFDEAVKGLAQKLDLIAAKDDPAALQQLETAIGALRGIVSHVASNDTLTKVADDVRALAAKVDALGSSGVDGLAALENRIEALANALTASTEAGQAVPRELEKLLTGLIEKLEWVQLTHTDHAALAHLEDRIATLVKRFDTSDTRFVHLEAVERGLADLLVHLDKIRGSSSQSLIVQAPLMVDAIERDVAEIKQSERRTQDSLEAVQGTVEHVVDRLAMIESDMRSDSPLDPPSRVAPVAPPKAAISEDISQQSAVEPALMTPVAGTAPTLEQPGEPAPTASAAREPAPARPIGRRPIDPNLPPDHPLEPGSAANRSRPTASAADRIAASEAAVASAKPPVIPDPGGKANFIAAARRAAQVAAATAPEPRSNAAAADGGRLSLRKNITQRLRTLLVAGSAVIIVLFGLHIASRLFEDGGSAPTAKTPSQKTSPPIASPNQANPTTLPVPQAGPTSGQSTAPITLPSAPPDTKSGAMGASPGRQSSLPDGADQTATVTAAPSVGMPFWAAPDITGSLPPRSTTSPSPTAAIGEKLPATIGGPVLRAAAMAGDASAAYEVAMRFTDGRGVPQNDEAAAHWLERAAKQGLALAQFRLGTLYEKGTAVKKDLAAARDLYLAAANKGNGKAMHNLAVLYAEGINGPADYRTAAHWFTKAAEHGISDSQYNLGILYARGIGVEQNFAESYKWFALAANQGDAESAKKRDEIAAKLDPQSLTAARLAVQTWSPQRQPEDAISIRTPPGGWDSPVKPAQPAKAKPRSSGAVAATPNTKVN